MKLRSILTALKTPNPRGTMRLMSEWQSFARLHFVYSALDSGLLHALREPATTQELIEKLAVQRPELLEGLLDLGASLGELVCSRGVYRVKGVISRMLLDEDGDPLAAMIQEFVTVYNDVYRHAGARMQGAPLADCLEEIAPLVARASRITEPFLKNFIEHAVAREGPVRLLEVGCGSGALIRVAHQANPQASGTGIDMDAAVVEQCRENLATWGLQEKYMVLQADIREPPAQLGGPFDLVTLYNNIYYFPPEERLSLLTSLRVMLAPGGALALSSSMQGRGKNVFAANFDLVTSSMVGCYRVPHQAELEAQLREAGFGKVRSMRLIPGEAYFGLLATEGS